MNTSISVNLTLKTNYIEDLDMKIQNICIEILLSGIWVFIISSIYGTFAYNRLKVHMNTYLVFMFTVGYEITRIHRQQSSEVPRNNTNLTYSSTQVKQHGPIPNPLSFIMNPAAKNTNPTRGDKEKVLHKSECLEAFMLN